VPHVIVFSAVVAVVLLAALAVFQVALAAGAPIGQFAWGGQHRVLPSRLRIGSAVSTALYAVFALIIWVAASRSSAVAEVGIWVLTAFFGLGIPMNAASRSRPERLLMTPVVFVLALCCLVIALQA
jgi:hypothetical protein